MISLLLTKVKFLYGDVYKPDTLVNTYSVAFSASGEVAEMLGELSVDPKESKSDGTLYYRAASQAKPLVSCNSQSSYSVLVEAMQRAAARNIPLELGMKDLTVDLVVSPFTLHRKLGILGCGLEIKEIRVNAYQVSNQISAYAPYSHLS